MKCVIDGLVISYEDMGQGKKILMLHGWGDTLRTFDTLIEHLSGRMVRVDLPGFGASDIPKSTWKLDNYVHFVKAFTEKLGIKPDILVGHSLGGRIVIKGVANGTLCAQKMVLIASAGLAERDTIRNSVLRLLAKIGRIATSIPPFSLVRNKLRQYFYKRIGSDYLSAGALRETFVNIIGEDLTASARTIRLPTLIVWGADDNTTPPREGKKLNNLIPGSTLHVLPHAGHFVHQEKPREVSAIIREFLYD